LRDAFLRPRSLLWAGRKSCPLAHPLVPLTTGSDDIESAFVEHACLIGAKDGAAFLGGRATVAVDDRLGALAGDRPARLYRRNDDPGDRSRWHFSSRGERVYATDQQEQRRRAMSETHFTRLSLKRDPAAIAPLISVLTLADAGQAMATAHRLMLTVMPEAFRDQRRCGESPFLWRAAGRDKYYMLGPVPWTPPRSSGSKPSHTGRNSLRAIVSRSIYVSTPRRTARPVSAPTGAPSGSGST
jgi:hypothetical protein